MNNEDLKKLIELIYNDSFEMTDIPTFKLACGELSRVYVNCRKVTYKHDGMKLIGKLIWDKIKVYDIDSVGGVATGAIPIAMSVAFSADRPINAFAIKKMKKGHGVSGLIDSPFNIKNVVIVEDVVTTGASTIKAINIAKSEGLKVCKVIVLVDREEFNGMKNIKSVIPNAEALIKLGDLTEIFKNKIWSNLTP